ncbi:MAG: ATP-binding cassette domain-containing protein [Succiniclasticum sp.]|nr:ATP-binding cassette domain-containing protein [Succiniclasticum sp.]MEE3479661.1 ATP-binding cassette domain-containing protein [Succiniclasticum sp.]
MIVFKDVSKTFRTDSGEVRALQHIGLTIRDGDIQGIIGFSGAGKSTLLRMINALEVPTEGHVEVDGRNVDELPREALRKLRKQIGMIFQQFNLLSSKTVYDNIAIPMVLNKADKAVIDARVKELLRFVGLSDKAQVYPDQLSGGQKQRIGIARALATNPSILLCDEATSALDPETTDSILELLERINREMNITIVVVTHEINVVRRICNRVAVMDHGRMVEQGSVLEVFSNPRQEMTKRFVQTVIPDKIPDSIVRSLKKETRNYKLLKLRFLGETTTEDLFYEINRKFPVETGIIFASCNELQGTALGIFVVEAIGRDEDIAAVRQYIVAHNVQVQEVVL